MEFIDLKAQSLLLSSSIQNRIKTVLEHSRFITKFKNKSGFIGELKSKGIPTMIDYPHPLHTQQAFKRFAYQKSDLSHSERASEPDQNFIIKTTLEAYL